MQRSNASFVRHDRIDIVPPVGKQPAPERTLPTEVALQLRPECEDLGDGHEGEHVVGLRLTHELADEVRTALFGLRPQTVLEAGEAVLLLPAKTRYEQDDGGTETTTERRVLFTPEIPRFLGETRAEWKILRELAITCHPDRGHGHAHSASDLYA